MEVLFDHLCDLLISGPYGSHWGFRETLVRSQIGNNKGPYLFGKLMGEELFCVLLIVVLEKVLEDIYAILS